MLNGLLVAAGILVGVAVPRWRTQALIAFAELTGLAALVAAALASTLRIGMGAALFAAILFGAALLAAVLPRLVLFLLLAVALAGVVPLQPLFARPGLAIAVAVAAVAALVALIIRIDVGMRAACALLGATLIVRPFGPPQMQLAIGAAALALFIASTLLRRRALPKPVPIRSLAIVGAASAALGAAAVLTALVAARELPRGGEPFASRRQRLLTQAPRGGLLWPAPSEAIGWSDALPGEFPRFPNLDAAYLGGTAAGLWKLAGTTLGGRLALNREVIAMRTIKDSGELESLRAAAHASIDALQAALPLYRPGTPEARIAQAIRDGHRERGCSGESFPPIAAAGPSAAEPHGSGNKGTLLAGDLVVTDIGCILRGYASDLTRTIPVGGKFTERQRKLYDAVYAAQQAAAAACKPGVLLIGRRAPTSLDSVARAAIRARGFDDHNPFGVGHSVGLFVHDPVIPGPLKPGMVITIEPGIYLAGELGIRIEDTYLVTDHGCEQLTTGFPADADSVERLVTEANQRSIPSPRPPG